MAPHGRVDALHPHPRGPQTGPRDRGGHRERAGLDRPLQLHERIPETAVEFEQVRSGELFDEPIARAAGLLDMEDVAGAREIVEDLLETDLRCLEAHAWLGDQENQGMYRGLAIQHYQGRTRNAGPGAMMARASRARIGRRRQP